MGDRPGLGAQMGKDTLECMAGVRRVHLAMVSAPDSDGPDRRLSVVAWRVPLPTL
ncbi:hypothetical protein IG631_10005 [Alternaria alternata]|nr:hypothetical protein IG631_10005 [Alternaria alternata]